MNVTGGSTDVTTYFVLRKAADGTALTDATIANMDLTYVRTGAAPAAKVDATALAAADSAHSDDKAFEVDATNQPGLYRVDWPDAAFAAGAKQVVLTVLYATAFTEHQAVDIDSPADVTKLAGVALTSGAIPAAVAGATGGLAIVGSNMGNVGAAASVTGAVGSIAAGGINNASFNADVGSTAYATNIIALAADKATFLKPTTAGRTLDVDTAHKAPATGAAADLIVTLGNVAHGGAAATMNMGGGVSGGPFPASGNWNTVAPAVPGDVTAAVSTISGYFSTLSSHGDVTWATATGFATSIALAADMVTISGWFGVLQTHGDTYWEGGGGGDATAANQTLILAGIAGLTPGTPIDLTITGEDIVIA